MLGLFVCVCDTTALRSLTALWHASAKPPTKWHAYGFAACASACYVAVLYPESIACGHQTVACAYNGCVSPCAGTELKLVVYRTPVRAGVSTAFYNNVRRAITPEGEKKLAELRARFRSTQRFGEGANTLETHMNMLRFFVSAGTCCVRPRL